MARRPTMNDVAREAGVSLRTVSRHVNGETNIDPVLAARITEAIAALGYRRNLAAASIRPGWTSRTVGLLISDLANPYYSSLARGAERVLRDAGYLLTIASSEENGEDHDRLVDRLLEQRVDGLIVVPPARPVRSWEKVARPLPPIVFVDRPAKGVDADIVLGDDRGGARRATDLLLAGGWRRIAFLGDSTSIYPVRQRLNGYKYALRREGVTIDDSLIVTDSHDQDQAAEATERLLADGRAEALFASNNRAALGALTAFAARGRRLPLVGYDDFESAEIVVPAVSVARHDVTLMGRVAAERLVARISGDTAPFARIVLPSTVIARGSELLPQ